MAEELDENSWPPLPLVPSSNPVDQLKREFEKSGLFRITPKLEDQLTKCINKSAARTSQDGQTTPFLPPLILLYDFNVEKGVVMAMLGKDGNPQIIKNELGSESTPAFAGVTKDGRLVYGEESGGYGAWEHPGVWRCVDFWHPFSVANFIFSVDLKQLGIFELPRLFYMSYFLRRLKITAEVAGGGGSCSVALMVVPIQIKSSQRLRLKEAAKFAGFQDVYCVSAEGLAAYYWFSEKSAEIEKDGWSKEFAIVELYGHAVIFKRSAEDGEALVVTALILLNSFPDGEGDAKEKKVDFAEKVRTKLGWKDGAAVAAIPVLARRIGTYRSSYYAKECGIKAEFVKWDKDDPAEHWAAKGAALLSGNPREIGRRVRNVLGFEVIVVGMFGGPKFVTRADRLLPEVSERLSWGLGHQRTKYGVKQVGVQKKGDMELMGCLEVSGVEKGNHMEVTTELSWEGIWRVDGVSKRSDAGWYEGVKWGWGLEDQRDFANFGVAEYEEVKEILAKVLPCGLPSKKEKVGRPAEEKDGDETEERSAESWADIVKKRRLDVEGESVEGMEVELVGEVGSGGN